MIEKMEMIERLKEFIPSEMQPCSMDKCEIMLVNVYRMWGGKCSIEEI